VFSVVAGSNSRTKITRNVYVTDHRLADPEPLRKMLEASEGRVE
jgi:hypothetical protein